MNWEDINDPKNEIEFHLKWREVSSEFTAEEIQNMINEKSVIEMVKTVNEHFWSISNKKVLRLSHVDRQKAVVNY